MKQVAQRFKYSDKYQSKLKLGNLSEYDRGWVTALFEGEGCVFFYTHRSGWKSPGLTINMTDLDVLRKLHRLLGGHLDSKGRTDATQRKPIYRWHTSGWETVRHFFKEFGEGLGLRRKQRFKEILSEEPKRQDRPKSCGSDATLATTAGYRRHLRRGEPACVTCCAQVRNYHRKQRRK